MMNKPAPKEPSMDEILSSIRQIIADDDAAVPKRPIPPPPLPQPAMVSPRPAPMVPPREPAPVFDPFADDAPLELSMEQIIETPPAAEAPLDFSDFMSDDEDEEESSGPSAEFINPEDIAFEPEAPPPEPEPEPERPLPPPVAARPIFTPPPLRAAPPPPPAMRPRPTPAEAAPMPDPTLSSDIAEELLEPTTNAAVRANFSKLNNLGLGNHGLTIEAMMRDMLRPMLKEWLDENLPSVVERMVEKEIARISRGG
jgi:cell pole-organizing protein PopZ